MRHFAGLAVILTACHAPAAKPAPPATNVVVDRPVATPPADVEPDPNLVMPCKEAGDSERIIADFDAKMWTIKAADPIAPAIADLVKLFATPCFEIARLDHDVLPSSFKTGAALHRWWFDGGAEWARSYLPSPFPRHVALAPTPRATLTLENADDPLKPLLCPLSALDDHSCGVETTGWRARAANAQQRARNGEDREKFCAEWARKNRTDTPRYSLFRSCLKDGALTDVLPMGAYQAPKDGWLVVAHMQFITVAGCQGATSLYDLASGAAYLYECRNQTTPAKVWMGRVPTGAIREAAWMMMLQHKREAVRLHTEYHDIPPDMPVARRTDEQIESLRTIVSTSDAPMIDWAWIRPSSGGAWKGALSGRIDTSDHSLSSYASELLSIADLAFQEGCAPISAPRNIPWTNLGPRVDLPHPDAPLFAHNVDTRPKLAAAPAAKPGCAMLP